jgi:hypothetical protein
MVLGKLDIYQFRENWISTRRLKLDPVSHLVLISIQSGLKTLM